MLTRITKKVGLFVQAVPTRKYLRKWDVLSRVAEMAWAVVPGVSEMAWNVLSRVTKSAWDVLSGVANLCGMFGPECPKIALDVLS